MSNKIGVKCVFGYSLSLSQHIDVEQDRGKCVCCRAGPGRLGFRLGWGGAPALSGLKGGGAQEGLVFGGPGKQKMRMSVHTDLAIFQ